MRDAESRKPMFNFEKLELWQKAIDFANFVCGITRAFPADERFGLTNQMRRAAVSISSNIAEGTSRMSKADLARFLEIAIGSEFEVVSQGLVSRRQGFINQDRFSTLSAAAEEQSRTPSGLRRSLLPTGVLQL